MKWISALSEQSVLEQAVVEVAQKIQTGLDISVRINHGSGRIGQIGTRTGKSLKK